jgi:D-alanine-D-alanine ligase
MPDCLFAKAKNGCEKSKKALKTEMKLLVIGGGISDEREVSLRSAGSVHLAAEKAGHKSHLHDWQGDWRWLDENLLNFDAVLPILHGKGGEDGTMQDYLEKKDIPYLGSGPKASRLCFNKDQTNKLLGENNVLVPRSEAVEYDGYIASELSKEAHVLKPLDGGSSIDTLINIQADQVDNDRLHQLFKRYGTMLLEEFVPGSELTVPVLEGKSLPIIEIIPPEGGVFDYGNKYNGETHEICPPRSVDESTQSKARALGEEVHKITGCRHISRVDIILRDNKLYVLEINTMPGLTDASLFPLAAQKAGMPMPEFVNYLIKLIVPAVTRS